MLTICILTIVAIVLTIGVLVCSAVNKNAHARLRQVSEDNLDEKPLFDKYYRQMKRSFIYRKAMLTLLAVSLIALVVNVALFLIVPSTTATPPAPTEIIEQVTPTGSPTSVSVIPTIEKIYPTPTLGATSTQDSYGFFRNCTPDPIIPNHCICEDFNYTVHIERDNCQEDMCPATITFTNEYGDTMWVDFFDTMTSVQIKSGDSILLPSLNETNWSISSAIPFFEE